MPNDRDEAGKGDRVFAVRDSWPPGGPTWPSTWNVPLQLMPPRGRGSIADTAVDARRSPPVAGCSWSWNATSFAAESYRARGSVTANVRVGPGDEALVDLLQREEAARQQPGADEDDERHRDFGDDQEAAHPPTRLRGATAAGANRVVHAGRRLPKRGHHADEQAQNSVASMRERQDRAVDPRRVELGNHAGVEPDQRRACCTMAMRNPDGARRRRRGAGFR